MTLTCTTETVDVYLALEIVFDSGYTSWLGANSEPIRVDACGPGTTRVARTTMGTDLPRRERD